MNHSKASTGSNKTTMVTLNHVLTTTHIVHPVDAFARVVVDLQMKEDAWDKHLMDAHEATSVAAPDSTPEDANNTEDVVVDAT